MRIGAVATGCGTTTMWLLFFGLLGRDLAEYAWWTLFAGLVAWGVALVLGWMGDRGVAVGVAIVTAVGWSLCTLALAVGWAVTGDWPLW